MNESEPINVQQDLLLLNEDIEKMIADLDLVGLIGSAIINSCLTIYWNGRTPAELWRIATESGARFEIRDVPYSLERLRDVVRRICAIPSIFGAGLGSDFRSIIVRVDIGSTEATRAQIENSVHSGDIPIRIVEVEGGPPVLL